MESARHTCREMESVIARREICKPEERKDKKTKKTEKGERWVEREEDMGRNAGSACFFYLTGHPGQVWVVKTLERQTVKKSSQ